MSRSARRAWFGMMALVRSGAQTLPQSVRLDHPDFAGHPWRRSRAVPVSRCRGWPHWVLNSSALSHLQDHEMPYEILIADDHPLFRSALHQALSLGLGPEAR